MLVCPTCLTPMKGYTTNKGDVFVCPACGSRAATLKSLRQESSPRRIRDFVEGLRKQLRAGGHPPGRPCPHCAEPTAVVIAPGSKDLPLDLCARCGLVFFDPGQYQQLYATPPSALMPLPLHKPPPGPPPLPGQPRPAQQHEGFWQDLTEPSEEEKEAGESAITIRRPDSPWQYLPALLGLPIELGQDRLVRRPYLTIGMTLLMSLLFLVLYFTRSLDDAIMGWGFTPTDWSSHGGLTMLTSFLLHAGFFHIITNLYFLVVFGNNVESQLGPLFYLSLLLVGHLMGLGVHSLFAPNPQTPLVGASGGISAVIGYYAIAFPRARLAILPTPLFVIFGFIRMPAFAAMVLYVILQLIGAYAQVGGAPVGASHLGHLGGLGAGILTGILIRIMGPRLEGRAT